MDFLDLLVPKVHWDLKSTWRKFHKFARKKLAICEETLCSPLFHSLSNLLLVDQALLNLNTSWRFSSPNYCKILLISPWTKVLKVCMDKIYVVSNLDAYKIQ